MDCLNAFYLVMRSSQTMGIFIARHSMPRGPHETQGASAKGQRQRQEPGQELGQEPGQVGILSTPVVTIFSQAEMTVGREFSGSLRLLDKKRIQWIPSWRKSLRLGLKGFWLKGVASHSEVERPATRESQLGSW